MTYLRNEEEVLGDPVRGIAPKVFKLTEQHLRHLLLPKDPDKALTQAYHTQYTKWVPDDLRVLLMTDVLFPGAIWAGRVPSVVPTRLYVVLQQHGKEIKVPVGPWGIVNRWPQGINTAQTYYPGISSLNTDYSQVMPHGVKHTVHFSSYYGLSTSPSTEVSATGETAPELVFTGVEKALVMVLFW